MLVPHGGSGSLAIGGSGLSTLILLLDFKELFVHMGVMGTIKEWLRERLANQIFETKKW